MAVSMKNVDVAFQGVGGKPGTEIWRIENFMPVLVPVADHGKFFAGDSYIVLRTTALKSGAFHYDVHFWLGKDTSQDEGGAAALKTVELDAALGGRAVQYRETQGHETDLFLSYFKPCLIPVEGGVKSGFRKVEAADYETCLFICRGSRLARVTQVPFVRQSLNHDDVFILDTKDKIFQFNGANSNVQERGKALEVVQYLKDTKHGGNCLVVIVDDGRLGAESDAGEFWSLFGGFAPLGKKSAVDVVSVPQAASATLFCAVEGKFKEVEGVSVLKRSLLDTRKNYLLDSGSDVYVWSGRDTSLSQRKSAALSAEELIASQGKPSFTRVTRIIEGFETPQFKSLFEKWPASVSSVTEDGRGKVAALLKQQGVNVKGLLKGAPNADDLPPPLLDKNGKLEVWRVEGSSKVVIPSEDHGRFFDAHCYIALYTFHGERKDEYFLCDWLGKKHSKEDESDTFRHTEKIANNLKNRAVQVRIFQGKEPAQFLALFQCFIIFEGNCGAELSQESTYLLHLEGTASYNSKALFVKPDAMSLNSSECFILFSGNLGYTWCGNFSTVEQQAIALKVTAFLKRSTKQIKEGSEPSAFWNALGGKRTGYPAHRDVTDLSKDPRLFHCMSTKGKLEVKEVFNFEQDDLLTEDVMILDAHSGLFVWVGQHASSEEKKNALDFGKEYLDTVLVREGLSPETPLYKILEGFEPAFFTTYFRWDAAKASVCTDSYQKRLARVQGRKIQTAEKSDSATQRKAAMAALNSVFNPQHVDPDSAKTSPKSSSPTVTSASSQRSAAMAALNSGLDPQHPDPTSKTTSPKPTPSKNTSSQRASAMAALSSVLSQPASNQKSESFPPGKTVDSFESSAGVESPLQAPASLPKEGFEETYRYDQLKVSSKDPIPGIDAKKREAYLSAEDFVRLLGVEKVDFYGLPKWKQEQRKRAVDLF